MANSTGLTKNNCGKCGKWDNGYKCRCIKNDIPFVPDKITLINEIVDYLKEQGLEKDYNTTKNKKDNHIWYKAKLLQTKLKGASK